ncbi:MAG: A24 family peptidase, partial [Candidatus Desulforudis sp.]|nr:A24 family peptidase [Desulforudis sp.]
VVCSLQGFPLGVAIFVIPFAMGGIGGGDVKLMGAIGALKGWAFTLEAALLTAVWGGVIALLAIVITHRPTALRDLGKGLGFFVLTRGSDWIPDNGFRRHWPRPEATRCSIWGWRFSLAQ